MSIKKKHPHSSTISLHQPKVIKWLELLEDSILVLLILLMLGLAVTQIVLRNSFDSGIIWGDAFLRVLVLWVGLFGAMVASRKGGHINIDVITRFINTKQRWLISAFTYIATALICGLLAYHSYQFVLLEYEDGLIAFADIPAWVCETVMPLAFGIITLRYVTLSYLALRYRFTYDQTSG